MVLARRSNHEAEKGAEDLPPGGKVTIQKKKIASPATALFAATLALTVVFFNDRSTIEKSMNYQGVRRQEASAPSSKLDLMVLPASASQQLAAETQSVHKKQQQQPPQERRKTACDRDGSFDPPGEEIIIDYGKVRNIDPNLRERLKHLTTEEYEEYLMNQAGKEHYAFMSYMSDTYGDCRHFMDIGTRHVTSSLALGSNLRSPVWTFDTPTSPERTKAFRGKTETEWQSQAQSIGVNIKFHNLDLLKIPDEEFRKYLGTWFVFLDTFHEPDTKPFERELFQRMRDIGFKGILGLDDIYHNDEMKKWWNEVKEGAEEGGYQTYDLTEVGHATGTGLVDFSRKVTVVKL